MFSPAWRIPADTRFNASPSRVLSGRQALSFISPTIYGCSGEIGETTCKGVSVLAMVAGMTASGQVLARRKSCNRRPPLGRKVLVELYCMRQTREAIRKCLRENDTVHVFQQLPEAAIQEILDSMVRIEVSPGEAIFQQGEEVTAMFVVEAGGLSVSKRLLEADQEEFQATTLGPGSYIGELGLFHRRICAETVRVHGDQPAILWRLNRTDFYDVIDGLATPEEEDECVIDFSNIQDLENPPAEIFLVSDGSASSAGGAVELALKQFEYSYSDKCHGANVTKFPYIRYAGEVLEITRRARTEKALVVYTLMREEPRNAMAAEATRRLEPGENALRTVDLWEPLIAQMEELLGIPRQSKVSVAAMRPSLSDSVLKMVDAIEFTRNLDDGVKPELWKDADVILIGLSRAGKTPLSVFLAQRGFKVANYPVVPDEEPPKELFDPSMQHKMIALVIKPERLQVVRGERMQDFGRKTSTYSSLQNCMKEVNWLRTFYMRKGPRWPVVDTTAGLEESAAKIIKILAKQNGESSSSPQYSDPSVA